MEKTIFHVDVNSAFLSWEAVYRIKSLGEKSDLREIPSAVGGDIAKRNGIILAKSIPAKNYKIQTAETIGDALKKCPGLVIVKPHYDLYEVSSEAFMSILREYTEVVEQYSIDEAYMDMTGTQSLWGSPVAAANLIKDRIYRELGFSVNIGVSCNKFLAKMASDFQKPNFVHTLYPDEIERKMWGLPVRELFFCGRETEKKLHTLGITTIGQLAHTDIELLKQHLKKQGEIIWNFAHGKDISIVDNIVPDNKGYGNSITIPFDVRDFDSARMVLLSLCETLCNRLRKDNMKISVAAVSLKDYELRTARHQSTLFTATNITNELFHAVCRLLDELWDGRTPIRQLGIHTSKVIESDGTRQLNLFNMENYRKYEKLDQAVDEIREKYGEESIMRATYINAPIRGMSGGVSKDKRTVDGEEVLYG